MKNLALDLLLATAIGLGLALSLLTWWTT